MDRNIQIWDFFQNYHVKLNVVTIKNHDNLAFSVFYIDLGRRQMYSDLKIYIFKVPHGVIPQIMFLQEIQPR